MWRVDREPDKLPWAIIFVVSCQVSRPYHVLIGRGARERLISNMLSETVRAFFDVGNSASSGKFGPGE